MASRIRTDARLAAFRKLLAAARLREDFRLALRVTLFRLSPRQREIVARYDLDGERVDALCKTMHLSRRQFFRDHRSALERLGTLMLPDEAGPAAVSGGERSAARAQICASQPNAPPAKSLANGLRNVGDYREAIAVLLPACSARIPAAARLETMLDVASLGVESGDVAAARAALEDARRLGDPGLLCASPRLAAYLSLVEGHLVASHVERQARFERARSLLELALVKRDDAAGELLVETLYAMSLSHDHRGRWAAAREAARESVATAERFSLAETPLGLMARSNYAMRDARQYGNVDAALDTLRACLGRALGNGWVQVTGELAVHFINLNLMRSHYAQALEWRRWLSGIGESRLMARTRNFLAVDTAHALTMLGRPDRARSVLESGDDEGLAFHGAREYWRAEALEAGGNATGALRLAARALEGAAEAESEKGRARSKRVLARCRYALGDARSARRTIEECLELSEAFVSPYDLLLSMAAAQRIEGRVGGDARELARLLRGHAEDAAFDPPANRGA